MSDTGEQLHPNWRALATAHIPIKSFVKEGTKEVQKVTPNSYKTYEISGVCGDEIREFYVELLTKNEGENTKNLSKENRQKLGDKHQCKLKSPFAVKSYFRFAMENNLNELKNMDFEGQNLNVCDNYGWSALMMASCEGSYEAVNYLLTLGVDRFIKDKSGRSAKDLAYKKCHFNIVQLLEKNCRDFEEDTNQEKVDKLEPFYCEICEQNFTETSKNQHNTSTIHQFNIKTNLPPNKLQKFNISSLNKGLQLMVKQGWDKESGLGPSQTGRLYPVKTVIRKQRTGLGIEQETPRVTHFHSYDLKAIQNQKSNYYRKKPRNRNDIKRQKVRDWKQNRRLRNELN